MKQTRLIDLSNYSAEDLILNNVTGNVLSISTFGSPIITVKGKDADLDNEIILAIIDMTTLGKLNQIQGAGLFIVPISGLDKVVLSVSGTGKIKLKEME